MWKSVLPVVAAAQWTKMESDVTVHDPAVSSWVRGEEPPADHSVSLSVVVRIDEDRHADLERTFWEVSNPKHANYGKYLSRDEVTEMLAVPQDRVERIQEYLASHDCTEIKAAPQRDVVSVACPVSAIETALNTKLHFFTHQEHTDTQIVRASQHYHLPEHMARDVVMVGELLQFPELKRKDLSGVTVGGKGEWPDTCDASTCHGLVTPGVLSARYRHPNATGADEAVTGNSMAVAEFQGQKYKPADLDAFSGSCHVPQGVDTDIGSAQTTLRSGVEAALDIEYMKAVAPDVPLTVVYCQKYSLLDWCTQITNLENSPLVHSVSYGNDERQQSSDAYMFSANTAFMKAGAQGISILFASGDQGVCGREGCGGLFGQKRFKPDFPAGSPYITAVGGTDFLSYTVGEEQVWSAGGGGFSDTFDIPAYQADAVAAYKARSDANLPDQAYWNNTGRGYPDVAALGGQKTGYCVKGSLAWTGVAGTSASSPVVAGIFAKLNGLRLAAGSPALGFLNPFIYQNPQAFFDVKHGKNNANQADGFTATEGWDPASGFGTPNYDELAKAAMASVEVTV
jgi:tripeptidyl-peptidase-1